MDEQAKLLLYNQLLRMKELNTKENAEPIINEEQFMQLSDKDALKYIFDYRDNQVELENKDDIVFIELPDLDLERTRFK